MFNLIKRRFWRVIVLAFVLVFTLMLLLVSVARALNSSSEESAGWWQTSLAALGFPLLVYGFYSLQREIRARQLTPEIEVGVVFGGLPITEIEKVIPLTKRVTLSQGYVNFSLVVRNKGKIPLKYVKILFENLSFFDLPRGKILPDLRPSASSEFEWKNNVDFVYKGGVDRIIYPLDTACFNFHVGTRIFYSDTISQPPDPGVYRFRCTIWAEGLEQPLKEILEICVEADPQAVKTFMDAGKRERDKNLNKRT